MKSCMVSQIPEAKTDIGRDKKSIDAIQRLDVELLAGIAVEVVNEGGSI